MSHQQEAIAQTQTFTLDRAQVSGAPDDGFMVHRPYLGDETRFYGNLALGYAHNPLRKDALTDNEAVQTRIDDVIKGQFLAYPSLGIQLFGRIGFNLQLPIVVGQITGEDPLSEGVGSGGLTDQHAALGDLRLDARGLFWESNDGRFRFGGEAFLTMPTGSDSGFGGDDGSSAALIGSAEYRFDSFFLTGHLGPHFRPLGAIGGTEGDLVVGDELRYAAGIFMPLRGGSVRLGLELWGSAGIESVSGGGSGASNTTVEWMGQARFVHGSRRRVFSNFGIGTRLSSGYGSADFRALASIGTYMNLNDPQKQPIQTSAKIVSRPEHYETDSDGDGYPDGIDKCPSDPEDGKAPHETDGCPGEPDADNDGIPDRLDQCVTESEDFDGLEDQDGCPEADLDNDTVLDESDSCPDEPGPPNADEALNGCPTMTKMTEDGTIALMQPLEFSRGGADLDKSSFPILEEVVTLLKARPDLSVAVHGHTDNIGSHGYNVKLSQDRADAVVTYLAKQGIAAARLSAKGFGPDQPLGPNDSREARAKNRRVEFVIQYAEGSEGQDAKEPFSQVEGEGP